MFSATSSKNIIMTRLELFKLMDCRPDKKSVHQKKILKDEIQKIFINNNCEFNSDVVRKIEKFYVSFKEKWDKSVRKSSLFLIQNEDWLKQTVDFKSTVSTSKIGRSTSEFKTLSQVSKRRRTRVIRATYSKEDLIQATHMKLRSERKSDSSRILKNMTENSPTRAKRYIYIYLRN